MFLVFNVVTFVEIYSVKSELLKLLDILLLIESNLFFKLVKLINTDFVEVGTASINELSELYNVQFLVVESNTADLQVDV